MVDCYSHPEKQVKHEGNEEIVTLPPEDQIFDIAEVTSFEVPTLFIITK
jgi:hypothetical protein